MTLSPVARQAVYAGRTKEVFCLLMTIDHPTFTQPIRVCTDNAILLPIAGERGIISRGEEYVFAPMVVALPTQDDSGVSKARISVDNIDRRITDAVRRSGGKINITMEIVLSSQPDVLEYKAPNFKLTRCTYDSLTVSGEINVEYFELEPYPGAEFNSAYFPGLF